tara:strand:+ start:271 stop:459 length:189 start_codon:yes stop_codon:yes gene_type:complete
MTKARTTTELLALATEALNNQDEESLENLSEQVDGWMLCDEEREVLTTLLDAMRQTVLELVG